MAVSTILQQMTNDPLKSPKEAILEALDLLPPEYLPEVLQFIQFLEYKYTANPDELSEDEAS